MLIPSPNADPPLHSSAGVTVEAARRRIICFCFLDQSVVHGFVAKIGERTRGWGEGTKPQKSPCGHQGGIKKMAPKMAFLSIHLRILAEKFQPQFLSEGLFLAHCKISTV